MIVVADASPLNYLILIRQIEILPTLYGLVLIPQSVCEELSSPRAPMQVREWISHPKTWLETRTPNTLADPLLAELDRGEIDAILLAQELGADRLIIDEEQGRAQARRRGIKVSGTLGVLRDAADLGIIDLRETISLLRTTSFRISKEFLEAFLRGEQ